MIITQKGDRRCQAGRSSHFHALPLRRKKPRLNEQRPGGFVDVKAFHNKYDLYYSILEGILFTMRQCYDILVEVGGPEEVLVSGGIVNSVPWMQMAADIFQRDLKVTATTNESTVGGSFGGSGGCWRQPAGRRIRTRSRKII